MFLLVNLFSAAFAASFFGYSTVYDYNLLTIEWKPTDCLVEQCPSYYLSENFNIHGLWPNNKDGTWPSYCNSHYDFSVNSQTKAELENYWKSYNGNPTPFWQHEWTKHGTCVTPAVDPDTYFQTTVSLFKNLDLLNTLKNNGVTPDDNKQINKNDIYNCFNNIININCKSKNGNEYLWNIQFCYDHNFNQIDCQKEYTNCGYNFYFPSKSIDP